MAAHSPLWRHTPHYGGTRPTMAAHNSLWRHTPHYGGTHPTMYFQFPWLKLCIWLKGILNFISDFIFPLAKAPSGPGPPYYRSFTITLWHPTQGRTPLDEWLDWQHRTLWYIYLFLTFLILVINIWCIWFFICNFYTFNIFWGGGEIGISLSSPTDTCAYLQLR